MQKPIFRIEVVNKAKGLCLHGLYVSIHGSK